MTGVNAVRNTDRLSVYLCWLLRHEPEAAGLDMDEYGWVSVSRLIEGVNAAGKDHLDEALLRRIVAEDRKGRYRMREGRIKACQGHTIPWVIPELTVTQPPEYLYHGTTTEADRVISRSGVISRMKRHAVHMHVDPAFAWLSATRRRGQEPLLLKIAAGEMHRQGYVFGVTENQVWCTEEVPVGYIAERLYDLPEAQNE
jgi:putative RNA 2'-phosphotransferase